MAAAEAMLQVQVRPAPLGQLTLRLRGELDLVSVELLDRTLATYPDRRNVRLEIGELDFIDGAGLNRIVAEHHRLRHRDGELLLTGARARIRRLLTLTGLDQLLHVV